MFVRSFGFSTDECIDIHTFMKFPRKIRKMPDFIYVDQGKFHFSEVKGCHDILRLKEEDMKDYYWWYKQFKDMQENIEFVFFVYSTKVDSFIEIPMQELIDKMKESNWEVDRYPDNNKKYVKVPIEDIF